MCRPSTSSRSSATAVPGQAHDERERCGNAAATADHEDPPRSQDRARVFGLSERDGKPRTARAEVLPILAALPARVTIRAACGPSWPSPARPERTPDGRSASAGRQRCTSDALVWDSHACLPLHPDAEVGALERHRAGGVDFVSINIGMDMNPLPQIMAVIASFRAQLRARPERFVPVDGRERRRARQGRGQARRRLRPRGRRAARRAAGDGAAVLRPRRPPDPSRLQPQQQHRRRLLRRRRAALGARPARRPRDQRRRHADGLLAHRLPHQHGHHGALGRRR